MINIQPKRLTTQPKVDFQKDVAGLSHLPNPSVPMEDNLNIINEFADTIASTLKYFVGLCREDKRRRETEQSEFAELQNELIRERKKRMELQDIIKQKVGESALNDPTLTEVINNYEERRRPRTAFILFMADCREKMMREHPSLTLQKATSIARIKWRMLKPDQKAIYQAKLAEMNKAYQERDAQNRQPVSDGMVKREFGIENEEQQKENGNQNEYAEQNARQNPSYFHQSGQQEAINAQRMTTPLHEQSALHDEAPKQKSNIQNILDLFHTQAHRSLSQNHEQAPIETGETNQIEAASTDAPLPVPNNMDHLPSLMIVEPASASHPIVIPPTVQE